MYFDGATTRATIGDLGDLPEFTVMFWVYSDAVEAWRVVLDANIDDFNAGPSFSESANAGGILEIDYANNGALLGDLPVHAWHHAAVTRSASGMQLYFDGKPTFMITDKGATRFSNVVVGDGNENGQTPTHYQGLVDELRIYRRAVSASDVATVYDAQK